MPAFGLLGLVLLYIFLFVCTGMAVACPFYVRAIYHLLKAIDARLARLEASRDPAAPDAVPSAATPPRAAAGVVVAAPPLVGVKAPPRGPDETQGPVLGIVECPHCHNLLKPTGVKPGARVRCQQCLTVFSVAA